MATEIGISCPRSLEKRCRAVLEPLCGAPSQGPLFFDQHKPQQGRRYLGFRMRRTLKFPEAQELAMRIVGPHLNKIQVRVDMGKVYLQYPVQLSIFEYPT
jgi:hypothetical protein